MIQRSTIHQYIHDKYGICPDTPFRKFPDYEAFRHLDNRKIFSLIMDVAAPVSAIRYECKVLEADIPSSLLQEITQYKQ